MWMWLSETLKCESGQNMWEWTDVEDETSTSETGKQGTCTVCTVCSMYSIVRPVYSSTICAMRSQTYFNEVTRSNETLIPCTLRSSTAASKREHQSTCHTRTSPCTKVSSLLRWDNGLWTLTKAPICGTRIWQYFLFSDDEETWSPSCPARMSSAIPWRRICRPHTDWWVYPHW
jgi:hypothetical protein